MVGNAGLRLLTSVAAFALVLGACRGQDQEVPPTTDVAVDETTQPTEGPAVERVDRNGAWVDTVTVLEEPNADAAVARLEAGDLDLYAFTISSPTTYARIQESASLAYKPSYGSYNELTFNPSACSDTARLNPFAVPKIREAMNWLVNRDHIIQEIMGGLGTARWVPINTASADRGRLAAEIRAIEAMYAYDPARAEEVITQEMEALGATMEGGRWVYNGAPVELVGLIRTEDERRQIGDYVGAQLESIGFGSVPDYKTGAEAAPIWQESEPSDCQFHWYTGGWVSTAVSRDAATNFNFFYTPAGLPRPLWQAYTPTEEFQAVSQRLNDADFATMDERRDLFAEALPMALEDSVRVWLLDRSSVAPHRSEIEVASDLSGSIYGTALWPYTLRRTGQVGGSVRWASASILTEPWNPVAGTNWIYDTTLIRATGEWVGIPDPNTGLVWPNRNESFEVVVEEGLPVGKTHDWVNLSFQPSITVPDDAWVDWDAANQTFITAADKYTETVTVSYMTRVTYPSDLFETVTWHDGSPLSLGDMVMRLIMAFDLAKEESAIFDPAQVPAFQSFMSTFRGVRIVSSIPLVVEYYGDDWDLDAENALSNFRSLWPYYGFGQGSWHAVSLGVLADSKGAAVFSAAKATASESDQLSYIAGPTLAILGEQLTEAKAGSFIPYSATLGAYIDQAEADLRWSNLEEWHRRRGHYWIGTGPFFLERAFPVEGTVVLQRNTAFPDPADKWAQFSAPAVADVEVDMADTVVAGQEATFDVFVTYNDANYAVDDIQEVKYLVFGPTGEMTDAGLATAVGDGHWQVVLPPDVTGGLGAGSSRLEVVVVSKLVALPSLGSMNFVAE